MDFIMNIRKKLKLTRYSLAKKLNIPTTSLVKLEESSVYIRPEVLCNLRLLSNDSWEMFGKKLDKEFLK